MTASWNPRLKPLRRGQIRCSPGETRGAGQKLQRVSAGTAPKVHAFPELMTADDVAAWLRTTRRAIYLMLQRGQLPSPLHVGRRVLWERDVLGTWISEKRVSSQGASP